SHRGPVAAQLQHQRAASQNRALSARENHGRPPVAATARPGDFRGRGVVAARAAGGTYPAPAISPKQARTSAPVGNRAAENRSAGNRATDNRTANRPVQNRPSSSNGSKADHSPAASLNSNNSARNNTADRPLSANRPQNNSRQNNSRMSSNRPSDRPFAKTLSPPQYPN